MLPCLVDMGLARNLILGTCRHLGSLQFLFGLLLLVGILLFVDQRQHRCDVIRASCTRRMTSAECKKAGRKGSNRDSIKSQVHDYFSNYAFSYRELPNENQRWSPRFNLSYPCCIFLT